MQRNLSLTLFRARASAISKRVFGAFERLVKNDKDEQNPRYEREVEEFFAIIWISIYFDSMS